jgi:hypothetical protein
MMQQLSIRNMGESRQINKRNERHICYVGKAGKPSVKYVHDNVQNKIDIVEYFYDSTLLQWVYLRKRTLDKCKPNSYFTIKNNLETIINQVTMADIFSFESLKKNLKTVSEHYDFIETFTNTNNKNQFVKSKNWRIFNNFVKRQLFIACKHKLQFQEHYHLEIGCGKLGDLMKYVHYGYQHILAIDRSGVSIELARHRLMKCKDFRKQPNKYYWEHTNGLRITLICSNFDKNFFDGQDCVTSHDTQKLGAFKQNLPATWKGFDTISCMFSIQYFYGTLMSDNYWVSDNKKKIKYFQNNIKQLLKPNNGLFFGIFLDSENIVQDNMKFIHDDGSIMYDIRVLPNKSSTLQTLQISSETWNSNYISEPKINKTSLNDLLQPIGLKLLRHANVKIYYDQFEKDESITLTHSEKALCFLNSIFIYSSASSSSSSSSSSSYSYYSVLN